MSPAGEIVVVPFHSKGHTFPATELARHLASRGLIVTLFLPSRPSSPLHANINVVLFSGPPPPPPPAPTANPNSSTYPFLPPPPHLHEDTSLEDYLSKRSGSEGRGSSTASSSTSSPPLLCAVVDVMMSHCIETCSRYAVPVVSFFTSSGCAAALEHAASKVTLEDLGPAGSVAVPGLPKDMLLTASDLLPELPAPGGPEPPCCAFDSVTWPPFEPSHHGRGCPPPPPFERGHPGSPPPPFPWGHRGVPPPHVAPGHGGAPPPSPKPGHHHHHPGGLLRPFHPSPPPPPHAPCAGPPRPRTPTPTQRPSPSPEPPQPGASGNATAAPARGPGGGGGPPRGLGETGAATALLFNTCDGLERTFLDYVEKEAGKPVWGVGPLLPARFWSTTDRPVSDEASRPDQQETTVPEADVRQWLDSKPPASVIYISFGTLVGPPAEELSQLAAALEESSRPFIWVLQADAMNAGGYFPDDLASRAGESHRGLVIRGWAPQLTILSHPSTAAFVSHCGWNSTVEALASGVPLLAWPVKGDQLCNARLVTDRLRVGHPVRTAAAGPVKKEDVTRGIERLMADEGFRARAGAVRSIFASGFPGSSAASVDAFVGFIIQRFEEASS